MLLLFAVMMVGFIAKKVGYLTDEVIKKLSAIVVNIANPALILTSVSDIDKISTESLITTAIAAVATYVFLVGFSFVVPKLFRVSGTKAEAYQLMFVFNNIGFMGFPIIQALYGQELLIYSAVFLFLFNVLIYTFGIDILTRKSNEKSTVSAKLKKIVNPGVVACLIALVVILFKIKLPNVVNDFSSMLGNITAPISMMCIGASLVGASMKKLFTDVRLLAFSLVKLIAVPLLVMFALKLFVTDMNILNVALINIATPVASLTAMLAERYDSDYAAVSNGIMITTILSLFSIPLMTMLMGS